MPDEPELDQVPRPTVASDKYKVPRGADPEGVQRRPGDARPGVIYTCPACSAPLRIRVSKYDNRYFAHVHGENTCNSETRQHLAAKQQLAELLDLHNQKKVQISMRVPCEHCETLNESAVPLGTKVTQEYVDRATGLRYDVALLGEDRPLVAFEICVTSPISDEKCRRMAWPWYELSASEVLGRRAEDILDGRGKGSPPRLTLTALRWTHPCNCSKCEEKAEEKAAAIRRDAAIEEQRQKAADRLQVVFDQSPKLQLVTGECPKCHTPRTVPVTRSAYDRVERHYTDEHGQAWDIGLLRQGRIALGVLVVNDHALRCDRAVASAKTSKAKWIAVPARTIRGAPHGLDDATLTGEAYIQCNSFALNVRKAADEHCVECARIAAEKAKKERERRAAETAREREARRKREAQARREAEADRQRRQRQAEIEQRQAEERRRLLEEARRAQEAAEAEARRPSNRIRRMQDAAVATIGAQRTLRALARSLVDARRSVRSILEAMAFT